jgi:putative ABC transport system permease protein
VIVNEDLPGRSGIMSAAMEIIRNLTRRKLRNTLTISGIVIGVLALVTMGAMAEKVNKLFEGGERYFRGHIQATDTTGNAFGGGGLVRVDRAADIERVPGVAAVFPTIGILAKAEQGPSFSVPDQIINASPGADQYEKFKLTFAHGRAVSSRSEVALGSDIAREFKAQVGGTIKLPQPAKEPRPDFVSHSFTVVGILDKTLTAPDNFALVTLEDAQMMLGESLPPAIRSVVDTSKLANSFVIYGKDGINLDELARKISREVPGIKATPPTEIVKQFQSISVIFSAVTTGSALLALVVGGLSVVNTMLMAVTERVREIGLKKAVGARLGHLLREFLLEAVVIGAIGGGIGVFLGWGLTSLINLATDSQNLSLFLVTGRLVVIALLFSIGLGALAGFIPALRAARLDPVRALRSQ